MEEEIKDYRSPRELNREFRQLLDAIPTVPISILGTVMDGVEIRPEDLTEEDIRAYEEAVGFEPTFIGDSNFDDIIAEQARGFALMKKRENSEYTRRLMEKLPSLVYSVRGTESFKQHIPFEIMNLVQNGISGSQNWLYGENEGGIFDENSVADIEQKSLSNFAEDVRWYGSTPFFSFMNEYDRAVDENYRQMFSKAEKWIAEFKLKYRRNPVLGPYSAQLFKIS